MLRLSLLFLAFAGCVPTVNTRPVRNCDADDPLVDCCTASEQCLNHFGSEFAICADPGETTGRCVECAVDEQCDLDSFCDTEAPQGAYCAPLPGG